MVAAAVARRMYVCVRALRPADLRVYERSLAGVALLWPRRVRAAAGNTMTVEESILSRREGGREKERAAARRLVGQKMPLPTCSVESARGTAFAEAAAATAVAVAGPTRRGGETT